MVNAFLDRYAGHIVETSKQYGLNTIYQWGVLTGDSMFRTSQQLKYSGLEVADHYGFDTFTGMPEEKEESVDQDSWLPGGLNASNMLGAGNVDECMNLIHSKLSSLNLTTKFHLIPGLAEDTMNDTLKQKYNLSPALLIDADFDIYSPTKFGLEYFIENKLITKGTIIYYDDWGGVLGWEEMAKGEARAHKEICDKYDIIFKYLDQEGNAFPHVHRLYQVESINY